jgi:pimeloyl-ACP methyl ester carboxylesterase
MTRIEEQRYIRIGGIDQWIQIRGENRENPVLFILHGGPGSPYALFTPLLREWERHFTVVQWDRRGAGKTLRRNGRKGCDEMTFDRCVEDAIELAEHLRTCLDKDKLVLMAGSMGTLVGLPLVQRRPDLFSTYVCTDQFVNMVRNEEESYRLAGDHKALAKIGPDPRKWNLRAWGVKMRFTMDNAVLAKLFLPLVKGREVYGLRDIPALLRGFSYSKTALFDEFMAYDARKFGTRFEVPFVLIQGAQDRVTVTSLAREHFAEIDAPSKAMVLIEGAGHFCAFTHPSESLAVLREKVERPRSEGGGAGAVPA